MSELYEALKNQDFYEEYFSMKNREHRINYPCKYELDSASYMDEDTEDTEWSGYSAYDSALDAVGGEEEFLADMDWEY